MNDIVAFLAVARERSFTKAAAKLGVSPSALSHSVRGLESRLGIRLLTRTTRNVAPTQAGERLILTVGPRIEEIETEIVALAEMRDTPAGNIRLTCIDYAIETVLRPKLVPFLRQYPEINVEITVDYGLVNIVEQRFDAGIRLGGAVGKDMIAVRIGPDWRFCVVGAPGYFNTRPVPQSPHDLTEHRCVNMRLTSSGGIYAWEFEKDGNELTVRVDGQLTFNSIFPVLNAATDGLGLAYVPEALARAFVDGGQLIEVLSDWCPLLEGYHLYYPNRHHHSPAFRLLVDALRHRQ